jgi:hypothetical protein
MSPINTTPLTQTSTPMPMDIDMLDDSSSADNEDQPIEITKTSQNTIHVKQQPEAELILTDASLPPISQNNPETLQPSNSHEEIQTLEKSKEILDEDVTVIVSPPKKKKLVKKKVLQESEFEKAAKLEEKYQEKLDYCQVMILDSLGNSKTAAIKNIKDYLRAEALHKKGMRYDEKLSGVNVKVKKVFI